MDETKIKEKSLFSLITLIQRNLNIIYVPHLCYTVGRAFLLQKNTVFYSLHREVEEEEEEGQVEEVVEEQRMSLS